jgi:hypothetical protein
MTHRVHVDEPSDLLFFGVREPKVSEFLVKFDILSNLPESFFILSPVIEEEVSSLIVMMCKC